MKKILMIGPFPEPVHGMSMANEILFHGLCEKGYKMDHINTALLSKIQSTKDQNKISFEKFFIAIKHMTGELLKLFKNKYDLIYITPGHSFLGFMRYSPYMIFCSIKKIPYLLHSHGGQLGQTYNDSGTLKKALLKFFVKKSKGAIVLGESLKWMFQDMIPHDKILVCHNGVPRNVLSPEEDIDKKIDKITEQTNLLYLSNLMKEKGVLDLLNSLEYLDEKKLNYRLNLAGNIEKNLEREVFALIEKHKDRVSYLGVLGGEEKRRLLLNSDIFILPTYYPIEGQPISILEAMINGCAIVTTDQGGIGDIFKKNLNGIECLKKNPYSIYTAILETAKELKKFQKYNYEKAINDYRPEDFVERVNRIMTSSIK
ncbi:glycosyltransferase family 4 protein [uncultured Ilyobacter sp.]|uniref:glycosyltransferase family 4 protein n=1 Tax=uncultured Ilyobacter sp. TaxID=544433 RepID=UPI0029C61BA8|nr:glycosyltransferase family 4 protein [uncultured Ilyobacter sp.]